VSGHPPQQRREAPRGVDAELEGYAWLPRTLDKARDGARDGGHLPVRLPGRPHVPRRLGISPKLLLDLAARHGDDVAVLDALRAHGIPSAAEAWFDGRAVEAELQSAAPPARPRVRRAAGKGEGGCAFAGAEPGAGVAVVLVDDEPGEGQEPHAHPSAVPYDVRDLPVLERKPRGTFIHGLAVTMKNAEPMPVSAIGTPVSSCARADRAAPSRRGRARGRWPPGTTRSPRARRAGR
jgi:hypothetical protein